MAICIAISYALIVLFEVCDGDISNLEVMFKLIITIMTTMTIMKMVTIMTMIIDVTLNQAPLVHLEKNANHNYDHDHDHENEDGDNNDDDHDVTLNQAPLVHLEKLLFYSLGLGKLPPVRRIKTE